MATSMIGGEKMFPSGVIQCKQEMIPSQYPRRSESIMEDSKEMKWKATPLLNSNPSKRPRGPRQREAMDKLCVSPTTTRGSAPERNVTSYTYATTVVGNMLDDSLFFDPYSVIHVPHFLFTQKKCKITHTAKW